MIFRIILLLSFLTAPLLAKPIVLVSIDPQKFFVEQIAKDTVDIVVLVPPGASPHSFEPTAKQLILASKALLWFTIGEPFEKKATNVLKSHNDQIDIIDTKKNISLLKGKCCRHCIDDVDTHIWLSPRRAKIQALTIKEALVKLQPENSEFYEVNYFNLVKAIENLDEEIKGYFEQKPPSHPILVSHPAFGYFCSDYNLKQLSIEVEGKDPSPKQLTELLKLARSLDIKMIFAQEQYQTKGAYLLAGELGAKVYIIDPYSSDYINNLRTIAKLFASTK
jgi:zinc transport system substrate-binding protein